MAGPDIGQTRLPNHFSIYVRRLFRVAGHPASPCRGNTLVRQVSDKHRERKRQAPSASDQSSLTPLLSQLFFAITKAPTVLAFD